MDLRYNRGGYVSSATQIASLIGKGISDKDVFYYKEYNKTVTPDLEKQYGKEFFHDSFFNKSQNLGGSLNRVFFLTSTSSASASELLINGLKPFMEVFLVGGKTVGKNVGSITISDKTNRIKWGIQPIVSRSSNSLRSSGLHGGLRAKRRQDRRDRPVSLRRSARSAAGRGTFPDIRHPRRPAWRGRSRAAQNRCRSVFLHRPKGRRRQYVLYAAQPVGLPPGFLFFLKPCLRVQIRWHGFF